MPSSVYYVRLLLSANAPELPHTFMVDGTQFGQIELNRPRACLHRPSKLGDAIARETPDDFEYDEQAFL